MTVSAQPLAVVGIGLRLPGGIDDLDGYWRLLERGGDVVAPMPEHRREPFADEWAGLPDRGGFLDDVFGFDAGFFGMPSKEARALDPQHRLLLEVSWEAFEDAGIVPGRDAGPRTGVYVGLSTNDHLDYYRGGTPDGFWALGGGHCFAAGRISYLLGLGGPAMAVDTACSSSLVAIHLAAQALRTGQCDLAVAGGVNLILSPHTTRLVYQTSALSPDGVCRTFDARANGFTRSEGCGVVLLKRLADARHDRDRIHAVIHGVAVNQDGRSSGLTAPNVLAQARLLEAALQDAGLKPEDVELLEAHGTGTALGDPIEIAAVAATLGRTAGAALQVGAVKTNLGHLEAAAGVAGLIKIVLCLRHAAIPPLVHFRTLNPRIELEGSGIRLATESRSWEPGFAGVSAFGMSGTNAHVILGPAEPAAAARAEAVPGFELSARSEAALRILAAACADRLDGLADEQYPAFAYTATHGRMRQRHTARVTASDPTSAAAALRALAAGDPAPGLESPAPQGFSLSLPRSVLDLPHYPWERRRHALDPSGE
ncbi:polyketide synthase [Nocardia sp. CDC159]|uniref:Polyketide synthase n=1 Tax=Nocardia pulmonis TaxID=2951408 RepID=A0A9X2IXE4_9NOCA|nr:MULTISPECIES: polyketide synthase [Nocardia]MCM6774564.1 polyketide synthase [Nocardia pulmonis]MCM6787371.1 polyketide synthase [Nocardia sp. CDC159]